MEKTTINIVNTIGDDYAVEAEDGQKVFNLIFKAIEQEHRVVLSFLNIEMVTTAFLNSAVGQLYDKFPEDQIKKYFSVSNISESGKISLKRVVDTAKLHYSNPNALKKSIEDIMNE